MVSRSTFTGNVVYVDIETPFKETTALCDDEAMRVDRLADDARRSVERDEIVGAREADAGVVDAEGELVDDGDDALVHEVEGDIARPFATRRPESTATIEHWLGGRDCPRDPARDREAMRAGRG